MRSTRAATLPPGRSPSSSRRSSGQRSARCDEPLVGGDQAASQFARSAAYGAVVHSIEGLATADLVDAMGRLHRHRCHIHDLVTPTPGRVLFGRAVTISYFPSCSAALDPERYNL